MMNSHLTKWIFTQSTKIQIKVETFRVENRFQGIYPNGFVALVNWGNEYEVLSSATGILKN